MRCSWIGTPSDRRIRVAMLVAVGWTLAGSLAGAEAPPIQAHRWRLDEGRHAITWDAAHDPRLPHQDRIELSGKRTAAIVTYSINAARQLDLARTVIWPTLRIHPNDTRGLLKIDFRAHRPPQAQAPLASAGLAHFEPAILVNQTPVVPAVREVHFENGLLTITSDLGNHLSLEQTVTPGVERAGYFERWRISAQAPTNACRIDITALNYRSTLPYRYVDKGYYRHGAPRPTPVIHQGDYQISIRCSGATAEAIPGRSGILCTAGICYDARKAEEPLPEFDVDREIAARIALVGRLYQDLQLECPDPVLNTLFAYSKIRASDSICETKGGPLHAPGGYDYYAAIWANDSVEYVGPFFPYLGYPYANQATRNALSHYARYLNPSYDPLPSSIIAEGTDIWARRLRPDGLPDAFGDCGDAAMLAFGGARFLLALGDQRAAQEHWPLIEWALEYCARHRTPEGVIASASDELEGRFASGKYNLNTSMLTYGGLLAAADLAEELGKAKLARTYRERAKALRTAVARYFQAEVAGYPTYQYYQGCRELRAWICMPLTMGIHDRKTGTVAALLSDRLWTSNGLLSAENTATYWDRSTLHALRGIFQAGEADAVLPRLQEFSRQRLLGEHVPYVIEAFPEGNARHLSAESALYCRIFTEGLLGMVPRGLRRFTVQPHLPAAWDHMALRKIQAFQNTFDLEILRQANSRLTIRITPERGTAIEKTAQAGEVVQVDLK